MIYIINHTFTVGQQAIAPRKSGSITQQQSEARINRLISAHFKTGYTYKINNITPKRIDNVSTYEYTFLCIQTQQYMSIEYKSITEAETEIARVSNQGSVLKQQKEAAQSAALNL